MSESDNPLSLRLFRVVLWLVPFAVAYWTLVTVTHPPSRVAILVAYGLLMAAWFVFHGWHQRVTAAVWRRLRHREPKQTRSVA